MSGKLLEALEDRAWYTPDFTELRFFNDILLLVYDGLQRYGKQHGMLDGAKYVGRGLTIPSKFKMMNGHDFPVVFDQPDEKFIHGAIRGECYLVSTQHILQIDKYQLNNSYMNRRIVKVALLDQIDNPKLKNAGQAYLKYGWSNCFMYVGDKAYFGDALLKNRPTRMNATTSDQLTSKAYYEWDPWESDWENDWNRSTNHYNHDPDGDSEDPYNFGGTRGMHMFP